MKFDELNEDNFLLFAIKNYDNPQCVTKDDFYEDLKRFKYIKRLFKRYLKTGVLKTHLLLNHIIVVYNIFGDAGTPLLFYKIESDYWSPLKSFMVYLNRITDDEIPTIDMDQDCLEELKRI
jgi:hypothetical protein|tara:strand:+ start:99 stop:461 length:363 start_codon:yes stop_codon:yes gene_type:complete